MCGIAGCFGAKDETTINRMLDTLTHRGPNDRGIHIDDHMVIGHTRLSVVDVAHGHQPILTRDGTMGLICNGEIYNFHQLREELQDRYHFRTHSDSEVILHLYRDRGPDGVRALDGAFAFALFDNDTFMLARDPVGVKPLYYGYKDGVFYFSSEIRAMGLAGVEEVHEFPPGHYFTPESGFIRFYRLPKVASRPLADIDSICLRIRTSFIAAVKKRLLADAGVPFGTFCSGGLDSSIIAAIAAREIPSLHTFVVGMVDRDGTISENVAAARRVADYIGSIHHERVFTEEEYYDALPEVINNLESYDPSLVRFAVPYYFICKLASNHVTVALTGEGADELFAGYDYMKQVPPERLNEEGWRRTRNLHNVNLQRADRMGMYCNLELRVPFLDPAMIELAMQILPDLKIHEEKGERVEKWIFRKAFEESGLLPKEIIWRCRDRYSLEAVYGGLGARLAEREISNDELIALRRDNPGAHLPSREAALYFKIFRQFHDCDTRLYSSVGSAA